MRRRRGNPGIPPSQRTLSTDRDMNDSDTSDGSILIVGSRVGTIEHLPPGYQLIPCYECGHQVWINGEFLRSRQKILTICTVCCPIS